MRNAADIANELAPHISANNAEIGTTNRRRVKLGNGAGVTRAAVLLTGRDVYYTSALDKNDRGVALLGEGFPLASIDGYYDQEVWLVNEPGSSQPVISGLADKAMTGTAGYTPAEQQTQDSAFPDQSRLRILRLLPGASGLSVQIDCGPNALAYQRTDGSVGYLSGVPSFDLSSPTDATIWVPVSAALSSGKHRLVAVAFDPNTDAWLAIAGDEATPSGTLPQRDDFIQADYEAINLTGYIAAGFVYMYDGQSSTVEDDMLRIFDPRIIIEAYSSPDENATLQTTNNTATVIAAVAVAELSAMTITGEVTGAKSDYSAALGAAVSATFRRASGGNVTLVGSATVNVVEDSASAPTVTIVATTGTQTADIKVTGVTAETWNWRATWRITRR